MVNTEWYSVLLRTWVLPLLPGKVSATIKLISWFKSVRLVVYMPVVFILVTAATVYTNSTQYPANANLSRDKNNCSCKFSQQGLFHWNIFNFRGLFGIYYRAYKYNPIVVKIHKLTKGFKLHVCFRSLWKGFSFL